VIKKLYLASLITTSSLIFSSCSLFEKRAESADQAIENASNQKVFFAPYDQVWKAAHTTLKYTIATDNQDYGVIETDFVKAVDGWIPPYKNKPDLPGSRYKLIFTFAKGKTNGRESTRVTLEKKIEVFKSIISDSQNVASDGQEEKMIFYRMEREIIIAQALKKAVEAEQKQLQNQ
jgi:hypothetical protein